MRIRTNIRKNKVMILSLVLLPCLGLAKDLQQKTTTVEKEAQDVMELPHNSLVLSDKDSLAVAEILCRQDFIIIEDHIIYDVITGEMINVPPMLFEGLTPWLKGYGLDLLTSILDAVEAADFIVIEDHIIYRMDTRDMIDVPDPLWALLGAYIESVEDIIIEDIIIG